MARNELINDNGRKVLPENFYKGDGGKVYFVYSDERHGLVAEDSSGGYFLLDNTQRGLTPEEKDAGLNGVLRPAYFRQMGSRDVKDMIKKDRDNINRLEKRIDFCNKYLNRAEGSRNSFTESDLESFIPVCNVLHD